MNQDDHEPMLEIRHRPSEVVSLSLPEEALASLKKVAASRDMSLEALIKFYVGKGLRQDVARLFSERVLETTAQVLARHIGSKEEIEAILREIKSEAA